MENWQCRIKVRGPGGGGGGLLFLDQTEAQRAEKNFFETAPPTLSQGLDDRAPHYLKVWIRRWLIPSSFLK